MKTEYEKVNGTIEGLRNREDPEIEDQEGDEDEGGDDDGDGDGDKPKERKTSDKEKPELHYSEGLASDGIVYVNDVGDEVKLDAKGRAYRVGSNGRKLMPSKRPSRYITPEEWKRMSPKEREASTMAADDIAREEVEEEDWAAKKKRKKEKKDKKKKDMKEGMDEMEGMFEAPAESEAEARASGSKDKAAPSPSLTDDDVSIDGDASSYDSDAYHDEWLEWEEFVSQQEGPGTQGSHSSEHVYEALVCTTEDVKMATPSTRVKKETIIAPSMPCIPSGEAKEHRKKVNSQQLPFPAAVSRPVSRKEMLENPEALKRMRDEWNGLTEQGTVEFGTVKNPLIFEYDSIRNESRTNREEIHFGRVHGIMVEKHWQLPKEDPRRKLKGRAVLVGNKVTNRGCILSRLGKFPSNI